MKDIASFEYWLVHSSMIYIDNSLHIIHIFFYLFQRVDYGHNGASPLVENSTSRLVFYKTITYTILLFYGTSNPVSYSIPPFFPNC